MRVRVALISLLVTTTLITAFAAADTRHTTLPLSVIAEPQAGVAPFLQMIDGAHSSIELTMYELYDRRVESALVAAAARHVDVRVLLNADYYGRSDNAAAYSYLDKHGVHVRWADRTYLVHQKTLTVDGRESGPGFRGLSWAGPSGRLRTIDLATCRRFRHDDVRLCATVPYRHRFRPFGPSGGYRRASAEAQSYPPYNIEKTGDDTYRLTMAVAGFSPSDIDITVKDNTLLVSGRVTAEAQGAEVLYRGIAGRAFERRFVLADHMVVEGADLRDGLLHVGLKRVVPEALKPRKIAIGGAAPTAIANDATGNAAAGTKAA